MAPQPYEQESVTGVHHLQCTSLRPAAAGQVFQWDGASAQPLDIAARRQYIAAFMGWMGLRECPPDFIEKTRSRISRDFSEQGIKEIGDADFEWEVDYKVWRARVRNLAAEQTPHWPWIIQIPELTDTEPRSLYYRDWRHARGMDNLALPNFIPPLPEPSTAAPIPATTEVRAPSSPIASREGDEEVIKAERGSEDENGGYDKTEKDRGLPSRPSKRSRQR